METENIKSAVESILFAAGEPVPTARISLILEVSEDAVLAAAKELADEYSFNRRGVRILTLDNKLQMCSSPEYAAVISKTLEQRKPPMLSQPALETLAVVAYFQPVTRAYIDQVRGVDSSYTVGVLIDRGLIERCGKLDVPGRPLAFAHDGHVSAHDGREQARGASGASGYKLGRRSQKARGCYRKAQYSRK